MEFIYTIIQEDPKFYAWIFAIVNVLWGMFLYFNNKRHDRAIARLQDDLSLESDRKRRVFELKTTQYEDYVSLLDGIGRKEKNILTEKFMPIMNEFLATATTDQDPLEEAESFRKFNEQISTLAEEGSEDYMKIQKESSRLKLTATDNMLESFERLENLSQRSINLFHEVMSSLSETIQNGSNGPAEEKQDELKLVGAQIIEVKNIIIGQMREELKRI